MTISLTITAWAASAATAASPPARGRAATTAAHAGGVATLASTTFTPAADYTIPGTQQQESEAQKKAANKAADLTDKVGDATIALGAAIIGYGALTGPGETVAGPVGLGIVAFGAGLKIGGAIGKYLWGDPFKDRHYTVIAKPLPVNIPTVGGPRADAISQAGGRYLTATLKLAELGQAFQTSINRALGAHAAHSKLWTVRQLAAAAGYARRGATLFLSLHLLREQFVTTLTNAGFGTVNLPAVSEGVRRAALKKELAKLPKALLALFKQKPLRGHPLSSLLEASVSSAAPAGEVVLASVLQSAALDKAEDNLAGRLRTFASIVKHVKPGHLPAGL